MRKPPPNSPRRTYPSTPLPSTPAVPEPRIIDGSARRAAASGEKKLSLSEWKNSSRTKSKPAAMARPMEPWPWGISPTIILPPLELLHWDETAAAAPADVTYLRATQNNIIRTLATFGISVAPGDITRGPTITRYEIYPSEGLRVSRISALEADLARATRAERINILAPIPGKDTVGIEIANKDKVAVPLRELLEDPAFHSGKCRLPLALGKDVYGETIVADLAGMPHLLVAGATGSGKSVCINSIIASLLFQFTPDQLRFILIDPKVVEMQTYNDLPHLVVPVVTDPKKVIMALRWVVNEMENRYRMFADEGVRNFETFNGRKAKAADAKAKAAAKAAAEEPLLPLFDAMAKKRNPLPGTHARTGPQRRRSHAPMAEYELPEEPEDPDDYRSPRPTNAGDERKKTTTPPTSSAPTSPVRKPKPSYPNTKSASAKPTARSKTSATPPPESGRKTANWWPKRNWRNSTPTPFLTTSPTSSSSSTSWPTSCRPPPPTWKASSPASPKKPAPPAST